MAVGESGRIRVGSAYITITPDMDQSALTRELAKFEELVASSYKRQSDITKAYARLREQLEATFAAKFASYQAGHLKAAEDTAKAKKAIAQSEAKFIVAAIGEVTAANEAALAKQQKEQAAYEKYVRASNARIAAAELKDIAASAKEVRAGIAAKEKRQAEFEKYVKASNARILAAEKKDIAESARAVAAAEKAKADAYTRAVKLRETQIKSLSALVIRQAQMEATEQVKAARTAQAAYTSAFNTRKTQILAERQLATAANVAVAQSHLATAATARAAAQQTIRANNDALRTLQSNATKASKSWTKATFTMGEKLNAFGTAVGQFGRSIQSNMVTPLLTAASAMSYFGISAADSMVQAQTALKGIGISNKDTAAFIKTMKEFGVQTPYSVEDMFKYGAQYTRSNTSHGMKSEEASTRATKLVQAVGDLAAYGGNTDPALVERTLKAVGNIMESDRASLRNVRTIAESGGLDVQTLARMLGFEDRQMSKAEIDKRAALMDKMGVDFEAGTESKASSQMMLWMAQAAKTGGIPGLAVTDAIIKKAESVGSGKPGSPAKQMGAATIKGRLSNMYESTKFGLSDFFISEDKATGLYKYDGAGAALMGTAKPVYETKKNGDYKLDKDGNRIVKGYEYEGGLLESLSSLGGDLKKPSGKLIGGLFDSLEEFTGWLKEGVAFLKDHPGLTDAVVEAGKFAALVGVASIALGALVKTFGLLTKIFSPFVGLARGIGRLGKAGVKTAGQVTGIGTMTDAEKEAKSIRQQARQQAREEKREARRAARQLSDPADRSEARREARERARRTRQAGESRARRTERQGQQDTTYRDRYQQRRTNANGGDNRSVARRAIDAVRGSNSQVEEIQVNTDRAKQKIQELDTEINGLKARIRDLKSEDLKSLAEEFAGNDDSVKRKAEEAAKAVQAAETAVKNLRSLQLQALNDEFGKVTGGNNSLKDAVQRAASAVSNLNGKGLGELDGELNDSKGKTKALSSSLVEAAKQAGTLNSKSLSDVQGQVNNVKDAADAASKKVGGGGDSLVGRIGKLNGLKTDSVVKEVNSLKDALDDTAGKANTLKTRLDEISAKAPGSGGKGSNSNKKSGSSALGGVLPGYTPGQDVHHFTSPTGGTLHLSGGEAVMRPEWTAAVGVDYVNRMNQLARNGGAGAVQKEMRFAKGGVLDKLGLQGLVDAAKNYNVGPEALGALATMTMDSSSRGLGGAVQKGVIGAGTDGSHFVGKSFATKFQGVYDFMTDGAWDLLRKAKIPDGWTQLIGTIGGAVAPVTSQYFWDDVWKGNGNILERGARYLDDVFSWKTLKDVAGNLIGGAWDSVKSLATGAYDLATDPVGFVQDGVEGVWELTRQQYTGVVDMVKTLREVWNSPKDYAAQVIKDTYTTAQESLPNLEGLFDFSGNGLSSKKPDVSEKIEDLLVTPGVGDAVTRWTPQVKMVLKQLGLPMSDLALVLHRIKVESGGNPKAINLWDSNAKAGYPSQGLMQTIPQTFAAYAGPYKSRGITDPLASIYAGLNYAVHRYGSGWRKALSGIKGYASGTSGADKGWAWVGEEGPELVNFKGGETVLNHQDSVLAAGSVKRGYASGTGSSTRTTGIAADAFKGVSTLNTAVNKLYSIIKQAFSSGRISSGTANSLNDWLGKQNKALQNLVKDRTTLATKLKSANTALAEITKNETEMATSIADKAKSERSLTSIFNSDGVSVTSAISGLKERLAAIKSFQSNISQLAKRGFSKEILAEVAGAGPVEGGVMAKELLNATEDQIEEFNSTYAAIDTASTSLGKSVAKTYYATGKAAAQALVNGLTAQDKALKKKIEGIADTIIKTLKSKLKVTSKTPVNSSLATLLTWLTGQGQSITGGGSTTSKEKKTVRTTTTYSTDSEGRKITTVTTTTTDPAKGTTTTVTKRTVGGKTTTTTKVSTTKGYATGTRSAARGIALVGERGTELVDFKGGERVYNNRETANLLGPRYEIHIHEAKSEDTTQAVLRAMKYAETMAAL